MSEALIQRLKESRANIWEQGKALLDAFGFPFKRGDEAGAAPTKQKRRGPVRGGKGAGKPAKKK